MFAMLPGCWPPSRLLWCRQAYRPGDTDPTRTYIQKSGEQFSPDLAPLEMLTEKLANRQSAYLAEMARAKALDILDIMEENQKAEEPLVRHLRMV